MLQFPLPKLSWLIESRALLVKKKLVGGISLRCQKLCEEERAEMSFSGEENISKTWLNLNLSLSIARCTMRGVKQAMKNGKLILQSGKKVSRLCFINFDRLFPPFFSSFNPFGAH
jgi:hypothetical protein